ncbi:asparagine synthetase B, partial [Candidatus Bathyarchaeota archaeon]|nr:asparagine synthetase B [Candidatus Bathyarchaeota archaeon]
MCGFVGWISNDPGKPVDLAILKAMNETLRHRGPDDEGFFVGGNIGMGHRRLSIIDTSEGGRQPIANETGSVVVVFNGEIYNFLDLKALLQAEGHSFQTQTDTEVLVHAYERWGEEFLTHLDGMFSLAIYDQDRRELILAKDPFGKKPLYYASVEGALLFASEIKALLAHPGFKAELDVKAIGKYLACDYIPSPWTA